MLRTDFTSRIARHVGADPATFHSALSKLTDAVRTTPTEPYEAVELGFEQVARSTSEAVEKFKQHPEDAKAAGEQMRAQNPKAFDAFGEFIFQNSVGVNQMLSVSDYQSDGNGIFSIQAKGSMGMNATLWVDTTPGESGIESMLVDNTKAKGTPPVAPKPAAPARPGEVATTPNADPKILTSVSQELGSDRTVSGLADENVERFADWTMGRIDLPLGTALNALPSGWTEIAPTTYGALSSQGSTYLLQENPNGSSQALHIAQDGTLTLKTSHKYRQPGDFEGSCESETLVRYPDGEIRRQSFEMHD